MHFATGFLVALCYSTPMKTVAYSPAAAKELARLPANLRARIARKIKQYADAPAAQANNLKAMKGSDGLIRLRVGDWRVLMDETATTIRVAKIGPRGSVYD